ncbi:DUF397 domain-containing protein [Nonomuraea sp. NPDC059023]|uniref:DUF397 domain-containing protein n=1 Tax=unclassified Nonomuraea TaxID=2593643 RepID=UPI0036BB11A8
MDTQGWRKSTLCNGNSACVLIKEPCEENGWTWQLRDGKDDNGDILSFTQQEWDAFTAGVRSGEFDLGVVGVGDA